MSLINLESNWTVDELKIIKELNEPIKIQNFLDQIPYNIDDNTKSPKLIIKEKNANCFEGALFAATCLRFIGYIPLIVNLRAVNDDDHVITVFRKNGYWGSIAKSNFTTLTYREPVYRNLRELIMSYFDLYFNKYGEKTLREFSDPLDLSRFDKNNWMTTEQNIEYIGEYLDKIKHHKLITTEMENGLSKVSKNLLDAGLLGSNSHGLYKPK